MNIEKIIRNLYPSAEQWMIDEAVEVAIDHIRWVMLDKKFGDES